jgi:predicted phage terminase large subunit-like protein
LKNLSHEEKVRLIGLLEEKKKRDSRSNLLDFTKYTFQNFKPQQIHNTYYKLLDLFASGKIKKLMVSMPPQHGKSEGSTRRLPAYLFGHKPNSKIAIASYSTPFARKFNREIQRIIDTPEYRELFPDTTINSKHSVQESKYVRTADEFEIIGKSGSLKAVGRGGALTGNPVDILIIDDLYKDYMEGNSPVIQQTAIDWYITVADSRLHNDSQQLIVFTRWSENDLIGFIESKEEVIVLDSLLDEYDDDKWYKINFEAIKESELTELDPRDKNTPLWEERHSLAKLNKSRKLDVEHFNCLYQGNPVSKEGLMYSKFLTYKELPVSHRGIYNYTDTADTGTDKLCSINYIISKTEKAYVTDILYTDKPMEYTESETAEMLDRGDVSVSLIESNNGGRGFSRNVKKELKGHTVVKWFHQGKNKESRIFTASAGVQRDILFPEDWGYRFPEFYKDITGFKKMFKANKHDDAPDTITGVYEYLTGKINKKVTINERI